MAHRPQFPDPKGLVAAERSLSAAQLSRAALECFWCCRLGAAAAGKQQKRWTLSSCPAWEAREPPPQVLRVLTPWSRSSPSLHCLNPLKLTSTGGSKAWPSPSRCCAPRVPLVVPPQSTASSVLEARLPLSPQTPSLLPGKGCEEEGQSRQ